MKKKCIHNCFLVTMYALSLYPNIDHNEGIETCNKVIEKCKTKPFRQTLSVDSYYSPKVGHLEAV